MTSTPQSHYATAFLRPSAPCVFSTSVPVQEGDKAPASNSNQIGTLPAVRDTPASGGADKSTGTNSPIHRPLTSGIFTAIPFVCVQAVLGNSFWRNAEILAARVNAATLILIGHSSPRRVSPPLGCVTKAAGGSDSPLLPPAFHQSSQDNDADVSKIFPIRIQVSGRRTAIRVGRFTQVQPKSISNYFRFLSWLVALVDLLGNHTRGVTQSVGAIDRKRGIFTQDKNTGAGGVRRRQSRNLARPGDWLQGR